LKRAFLQGLTANSAECARAGTLDLMAASADPVSPRRLHTAAMLGLALSFGTSGGLLLSGKTAWASQPLSASPGLQLDNSQGSLSAQSPLAQAVVPPAVYHTASDGDSFWTLAEQYGLSVADIKAANSIGVDDVLKTGQVLRIPTAASPTDISPQSVATIASGGMGGAFSSSSLVSSPSAEERADLDLADLEVLVPPSQLAHEAGVPQEVATASLPLSLPLHESGVGAAAPVETAESLAPAEAEYKAPSTLPAGSEDNPEEVRQGDVGAAADKILQPAAETDFVSSKVRPHRSGEDVLAAGSSDALTLPADQASLVDTVGRTVEPGETLWNIAAAYGLVTDELLQYNPSIRDPRHIQPGDVIQVPVTPTPAVTASSSISTELPPAPLAIAAEALEVEAGSLRPVEISAVTAAEPSEDVQALQPLPEIAPQLNPQVQPDTQSEVGASVAVRPSNESGAVIGGSEPTLPSATIAANQAPNPSQRLASEARIQQNWDVRDVSLNESSDLDLTAEQGVPRSRIRAAAQPRRPVGRDATVVQPSDIDASLLAAAPIGVTPHLQDPEIPTGQTVSPDMPLLPDSGDFLPETPDRSDGFIWPTQGVFTSGFGWRWGRMHNGIDIAGPVGTPIVAAASGVVVKSGWNSGGYGNLVDIRHPDGSLTRYAHNSRLLVREGQQVRQGDRIAEMGSTGFSTGPHLHFELHIPQSGAVNPMAYLSGQ